MNKKYSRYITGALILIMVFVAAIRMQIAASVGIDFNDTRIVITGPSGTEPFSIDYREIQSITLIDNYNSGTKVSGVQNRRLYYGTFHNDVYGTYALCAVPSIPSAIEIRTKNGIILFNYESEKVTAALSTSLTEFVSEKQQ